MEEELRHYCRNKTHPGGYEGRRSDNMWILETNDGDRWTYDENELENARRDKYIFGGKITHVEDTE